MDQIKCQRCSKIDLRKNVKTAIVRDGNPIMPANVMDFIKCDYVEHELTQLPGHNRHIYCMDCWFEIVRKAILHNSGISGPDGDGSTGNGNKPID